MSLTFVHCKVCGEHARFYTITYPIEQKQCDKCHTYLGPRTETVHFCGWKCMMKWLKKRVEERK